MDDEADRMRKDVHEHLNAVVVSQIEVGGIGAVPTVDTDADSHYLLYLLLSPMNAKKVTSLLWNINI